MFTFGGFLLLGGRPVTLLGRRCVFMAGSALLVTSPLCGSPSHRPCDRFFG
jgi:hypothetical protein